MRVPRNEDWQPGDPLPGVLATTSRSMQWLVTVKDDHTRNCTCHTSYWNGSPDSMRWTVDNMELSA